MREAQGVRALDDSASLVAVVQQHVVRHPERVIYTLLDNELQPVTRLTYAELDLRARAIASKMADRRGERAILLYPPGADFVTALFGCFYAGVVAIPVDIPRPGRGSTRLDSVAASAVPELVLTTAQIADPDERILALHPLRTSSCWLATDKIDSFEAGCWEDPGIEAANIALLQYTSGSISSPKGAVISHQNLLANSRRVARHFAHDESSRLATWLPHYHDMGLIGTILHPVLLGFSTTALPPMSFVQQPLRWLRMISKTRATTSGAPNFAYDLCVQRLKPETKKDLDLSSWELAFNGAEPVRESTIERFSAAFADCGFRKEAFFPCYGMAEATLFVSGGPKSATPRYRASPKPLAHRSDAARAHKLVSCGPCAEPSDVRIVDPETLQVQRPGKVGEIWLRGPCVAHGYWRDGAVDRSRFEARLRGDCGGGFFRTGDLGMFMEGELYLVGRLTDTLIIAGANHHPDDIEHTVDESHPWIATGRSLAFGADDGEQERLVVALELNRRDWALESARRSGEGSARRRGLRSSFDRERLIGDVRAAVTRGHGLRIDDIVFVPPGALPRTTSGKLRRRAAREAYRQGAWSGRAFATSTPLLPQTSRRAEDGAVSA